MHQVRQYLPLVTWLVTLVVAILLFTAMGSGPLAAPDVTEPSSWGNWAAAREPVVATVAVLRLVVLALAWYLVGVTTIGAIARIARLAALVRVADALSVPVVRRVLQTSLGVGLATAVVASAATGVVPTHRSTGTTSDPTAATPATAGADTPTMQALGDTADEAPPERPSMERLDDRAPPPPGMRPLDAPGPRQATPVQADGAEPAPATDVHTVRSGDHLWSIAHDHLAARGGHPTDAEVTAYWERLIEANRDRLVDPGNPDLIVPGQEFVLPDVEVAG